MKKLPIFFAAMLVGSTAVAQVNDPAGTTAQPTGTTTTNHPGTTEHHKDRKPGFSELDANNDGVISKSEASRHGIKDEKFRKKDRDGDGQVSREEYTRAMQEKHEKRGSYN